MFDVGFWELSLLAVLGLLILGPERLPRVVHTAGLWLGRARGAVRKLQREVQRELMIEETRAAVEEARRAVREPAASMDSDADSNRIDPGLGPDEPPRPRDADAS